MLVTENDSAPGLSFLAALESDQLRADVTIESRSRESQVPAVSVYRWWARRTEAVIGSIIDAFAATRPGRLDIADLFAGGGTVPLAALRRGHRVYAQEINPWAAQGLELTLKLMVPSRIEELSTTLKEEAAPFLDDLYGTQLNIGTSAAVAHTIRVLRSTCTTCGHVHRCFPYALVSLAARRERSDGSAFLACKCGHLWKASADSASRCPSCSALCHPDDRYLQGRIVSCPSCGSSEKLNDRLAACGPEWEVVLVERTSEHVRELSIPTELELMQSEVLQPYESVLKDIEIPSGPETQRLRRAGFLKWSDIYPSRQEYALNLLLGCVGRIGADRDEERVLKLAIAGCAEMPGLLSRWDRFYLKQYEAMAGHRISPTTLVVEPNVWGAPRSGRGSLTRRLRQLHRASRWMHDEIELLPLDVCVTELSSNRNRSPLNHDIHMVQGDSRNTLLEDSCVDLVLTDPPYHNDVQYADLASLFEAWQRLEPSDEPLELLASRNDPRHLDHLCQVFQEAFRVLRGTGHLVLTFANRSPIAWVRLFESLQHAGFWPEAFTIVYSENEIDGFKRGKRSCVHDLVMDLVKCPSTRMLPTDDVCDQTDSDEVKLLRLVASYFMRVGNLDADWAPDFTKRFVECDFVRNSRISAN